MSASVILPTKDSFADNAAPIWTYCNRDLTNGSMSNPRGQMKPLQESHYVWNEYTTASYSFPRPECYQ